MHQPVAETAAERVPPLPPGPLQALPRADVSTTVLATLAVVAALWWGQRFLIPVVAGLMMAMLVMPLAIALQRRLRSAAAASVLTLLMVMAGIALAAMVFGGQLVRVAERAPEMISTLATQMTAREPDADSLLRRARDALRQLDRAAEQVAAGKPPTWAARRAAAKTAATASLPNDNITETATEALRDTAVTGTSVLFGFAAQMSISFFIAFFVLMGGRPLRERFLGLWSAHPEAHERAQRALLECARQTRLYAGVLVVTNTVVGLVVWALFAAADLPDAAGWGVTAAVLHVVPYLGMAVLTVLGGAEAFLAHESVGAGVAMALTIVALSTLIGTLVTAWLQGHAAKMNAAAMFIGIVFWGALWGLWGLFLGPALVVLMKVVAEHSRNGQQLSRLMEG